MLIYSGCRVGEYRHIRKTDVKLRRRIIVIRHSKTDAGAGRLVPIPRKLLPWYEEAMQTPQGFGGFLRQIQRTIPARFYLSVSD